VEIINGASILTRTDSGGHGGDISITADSLLVDGGPVFFALIDAGAFSNGNAGNVIVNVDSALSLVGGGEISVDTSSSGNAGNLSIHARSLSIDGSAQQDHPTGIFAQSNPDATGDAGNLTIAVDQALNIVGRSEIGASTFSSGNGGNLTIHAGSLSIDGSATATCLTCFTGIAAGTQGSGDAGNLSITVDRALSIAGHGTIEASTHEFSSGNGGSLTIHAGSLSIDGSATPDLFTGIGADAQGSGDAGNLSITVDRALSIAGHGEIETITFSSGNGGSLTIHAGSLSIDGSATPDVFTGIASESGQSGATGNAGDVNIVVDQALNIVGSGEIAASTFSRGNAGNLTIHAASLSIDGSATPDMFTGIASDTQGSGDAGNLSITVDRVLSIAGHGQIEVSTNSSGKGGNVTVNAESIFIDNAGQPPDFTGIFAETFEGTGNGGNVAVNAKNVLLQNGGSISAASFTSAAAGSVHLSLGTLTMDTGSSISSANNGSGLAGSVVIDTTGPVKLKHDSSISTLSEMSDAGSIDILSGGEIKLKDQSSITVSGGHNGGDIHLTTPDLLYLLNSSITATAGASGVSGAGGNITIDSQFIVLQQSFVSANAAIGQGGNITLVSDFFFNSDLSNNNITATGATNGTVNITAPALDLGAQLITLPVSLLSAESQLQERCTALLQGDFSSFISIGRGGTEPAPEELQSTF
jgi:large exoprotein involved in heme utilization and adhesion